MTVHPDHRFRVLGMTDRAVDALVTTPEGDVLAASRDGRILRWSSDPNVPLQTIVAIAPSSKGLRESPRSLALAPDGRTLVFGTTDGWVARVDATQSLGEALTISAAGEETGVGAVAISPDGALIAVGERCEGQDDMIVLRRMDGTEVWRGQTGKWIYGESFSRDGSSLAVCTWDGLVIVVDMQALPEGRRGKPKFLYDSAVTWPGGPVFAITWLDSLRIAIGGYADPPELDPPPPGPALVAGGFARICNLGTGDILTLEGPSDGVHVLASSPQGDRLAGAGNEGVVWVWRVADGALMDTLEIPSSIAGTTRREAFPSHADFYEGSGATSVFALAWRQDGEAVTVGTQGGAVIECRLDPSAPTIRQEMAATLSSLG